MSVPSPGESTTTAPSGIVASPEKLSDLSPNFLQLTAAAASLGTAAAAGPPAVFLQWAANAPHQAGGGLFASGTPKSVAAKNPRIVAASAPSLSFACSSLLASVIHGVPPTGASSGTCLTISLRACMKAAFSNLVVSFTKSPTE